MTKKRRLEERAKIDDRFFKRMGEILRTPVSLQGMTGEAARSLERIEACLMIRDAALAELEEKAPA
jgi:hypothetical protein